MSPLPWSMPFVQTDGARVHYEDSGSGRAVIMVPGIVSDHRYWRYMAEFLSPSFRTVCVDNRGQGATEYGGPFTMDDMQDDLISIMDSLGIERANLIGWSMGSHVCLDAAARYPGRAESLCLVSSHCRRPARSAYLVGEMARAYAEGRADGGTVAQVLNQLSKPEGWFAEMERSGRQIRKAEMPPPGRMMDQVLAVDGYEPYEHARAVSCPVLSVHGLLDIMTEPSAGDMLADMFRDCRRIRIPGEGHLIPQMLYADDYLAFLNSV